MASGAQPTAAPAAVTAYELARGRRLVVGPRTLLMGVVNATPDSFWEASRTPHALQAVERALQLVAEGADIIDVGGESTRPGASPVGEREEADRVLPVLEGIRKASDVVLSVDTSRAAVARAAVDAGADIVNDVTGFAGDPAMAQAVAETGAIGVLMHMRGTPLNMQQAASYADVVLEVKAELGLKLAAALRTGIARDRVWIDPGLGFAKTARHSLELLRRLDEFRVFELPILVGASRKSFLGRALGEPRPQGRLEGSLAAAVAAVMRGANVLRVHDVDATRRAVRVAEAILDPSRVED